MHAIASLATELQPLNKFKMIVAAIWDFSKVKSHGKIVLEMLLLALAVNMA